MNNCLALTDNNTICSESLGTILHIIALNIPSWCYASWVMYKEFYDERTFFLNIVTKTVHSRDYYEFINWYEPAKIIWGAE